MNYIEIENQRSLQFSNRQQVVIERGQGSLVWDVEGVRYLDFTSGWGVTCLGHAHPVIVSALQNQAAKVIQNPNSGFTYSVARAELLALLCPLLPGTLNRLFFANSGAEANDAALKLARKITRRSRVISTFQSFHGRTFNTLSVSGDSGNARRFPPAIDYTDFVPFGELSPLDAALCDDTAALIIEPIQGEGGVRIPAGEYLSEVSKLCRQRGAMLIVDEIQTGFGRTGKLFALEHSSDTVCPDFLTLGKGIAGGFPFAGFAVTEEIAEKIEQGDHGGTFCGNPLGCAVSTAVVSYLLEQDIASQVQRKGEKLLSGLQRLLRKFPQFAVDVRGAGLLTAIELVSDHCVQVLTTECLKRGLLVTPTRNAIIRLIPDLLVSEAHIEEALSTLECVFSGMGERVAAAS